MLALEIVVDTPDQHRPVLHLRIPNSMLQLLANRPEVTFGRGRSFDVAPTTQSSDRTSPTNAFGSYGCDITVPIVDQLLLVGVWVPLDKKATSRAAVTYHASLSAVLLSMIVGRGGRLSSPIRSLPKWSRGARRLYQSFYSPVASDPQHGRLRRRRGDFSSTSDSDHSCRQRSRTRSNPGRQRAQVRTTIDLSSRPKNDGTHPRLTKFKTKGWQSRRDSHLDGSQDGRPSARRNCQ